MTTKRRWIAEVRRRYATTFVVEAESFGEADSLAQARAREVRKSERVLDQEVVILADADGRLIAEYDDAFNILLVRMPYGGKWIIQTSSLVLRCADIVGISIETHVAPWPGSNDMAIRPAAPVTITQLDQLNSALFSVAVVFPSAAHRLQETED